MSLCRCATTRGPTVARRRFTHSGVRPVDSCEQPARAVGAECGSPVRTAGLSHTGTSVFIVHVCEWACVCCGASVDWVLSFCCVGPGSQTQVPWISSRCLYPLSRPPEGSGGGATPGELDTARPAQSCRGRARSIFLSRSTIKRWRSPSVQTTVCRSS